MTARKLGLLLMAAAAGVALWAWSAVVVCGKCGHEAAQDEALCAHCGAVITRPAASDAPSPEAPAADAALSNIASQALAAVREDVRMARENEARPELALAFYGNALALMRLVPQEAAPAEAGNRLIDGMTACRNALSHMARPCPTCGGTGSRGLKLQSLTGGEEKTSPGGVVCETCDGAGAVRSGRTANELRVVLAQGRREFEVREQAAGRVTVGRAWIPPALVPLLDLKAQVLLRSATAAPCKSCQGIGRQTCAECRGLGRIKCRQAGCEGGWVLRKSTNTLAPKTALRQRMPCPACQGSGWTGCTTCRGSGAVACAACQGSGQPPRCNRCGGEGIIACTRCRGSGQVGKLPCDSCGAAGKMLCPTCYGEGHLSR